MFRNPLFGEAFLTRSKKSRRKKQLRRSLVEGLEKRMLMASDLPLPLVTGLSRSTQVVDQYIGFGMPAKPYSAAELAADLDKPVTVGPLSNV